MINFKGVTPAPVVAEPPAQPPKMSIQEAAPQVEAPQMKRQLEQDTVEITNK